MTSDGYRRKAAIIRALAHPSRLAMVDALADGERCVCELRELVAQDMSTVSRHLAILRDAGVVCDHKRGLFVYYRLCTPCVAGFLNCIDAMMDAGRPCSHCATEPPGLACSATAGDCLTTNDEGALGHV